MEHRSTTSPSFTTELKVVRRWLGTGSINLFGLPFAGKDVQARQLATWLDAPIIGGGQILRAMVASGKLSQETQEILHRGELIPRDEYIEIVAPYLAKEENNARPLVLNCVGRYHGEEGPIMQAAEAAGHAIKVVVFLTITEAEAWRRQEMAKQLGDRGERAEDHEETVPQRFKEFTVKTQPVIDFYRRKGLLVEVDGTGSVTEVADRLHSTLHHLAVT